LGKGWYIYKDGYKGWTMTEEQLNKIFNDYSNKFDFINQISGLIIL